ncbi:hypothetical protein OG21DRAFT_1483505 [Imleria badia]|nr:hypothetical protein OG21DRAFT_1483505 [Imleria badia]
MAKVTAYGIEQLRCYATWHTPVQLLREQPSTKPGPTSVLEALGSPRHDGLGGLSLFIFQFMCPLDPPLMLLQARSPKPWLFVQRLHASLLAQHHASDCHSAHCLAALFVARGILAQSLESGSTTPDVTPSLLPRVHLFAVLQAAQAGASVVEASTVPPKDDTHAAPDDMGFQSTYYHEPSDTTNIIIDLYTRA